jgi:hypothetical protein
MAGLYEEKILGAEQSRELARKLRESGEAIPQGQMVSGWYVPPSIAQSLAGVLKQGIGAYKENQAEDEIKGFKQERARASADAFSQMGMQAPSGLLAEAGTPAQKPSIMDRIGAALTFNAQPKGTPAQPYQQTIAQNVTAPQSDAALLSLMSSNPELGAGAIGLSTTKAVREATAEKEKYERARNTATDAEKVREFEIRALETERANKASEDLRQAVISSRQPPQAPQGTSTIVNPANKDEMIVVDTYSGRVIGSAGAEPKSLIRQEKAQAKIDEQAKGQESFQSTLYNLRDEYETLNSLGSMKTDQNSSIANALGVKLKTSTGQLLGTKTGTAISNIEQARKSIIQDIKNATGMSAGQLNSNFELQNMLATVTDPNSSYEAVQDQLNTLSQKFGTGEAIFPERIKLKQQANMVQGQAPVTTQSQVKSSAEKGWVLHTDAKGNKAYVNPQNPNEFEEVK